MMNVDWNSLLLPLSIVLLIFAFALLFREQLKTFIRRLREVSYKDKSGRAVELKADPESSLSQTPLVAEEKELAEVPASPSSLARPISSNLPNKLYSAFVGREDEISKLLSILRSPKANLIVGIDGLGGIGKTALAREIAEQALTEGTYKSVYWQTAKRTSLEPNERTVKASAMVTYSTILSDIINWLGIGKELHGIRKVAQKEKRIREIFSAYSCLIVLDNLETADENQNEIAARLKRILKPSKAILTSRQKWEKSIGLYSVSLSGLSSDNSIRFMREVARENHIDRVIKAKREQLLPVVELVGGVPLALKLLTGLLSAHDVSSLETSLTNVPSKKISEMYRYLFLGSWRQLNKNHQRLLLTISQFSEEGGASASALRSMRVVEDTDFNDAINKLVELSLVEVSDNITDTRYFLHPLTINFINSDLLKQV